jgi:hypothetical protein
VDRERFSHGLAASGPDSDTQNLLVIGLFEGVPWCRTPSTTSAEHARHPKL